MYLSEHSFPTDLPGVRSPRQLLLLIDAENVEDEAVLEIFLVDVVHVERDVVAVLAVSRLQAQLELELLRRVGHRNDVAVGGHVRGGGGCRRGLDQHLKQIVMPSRD